MDSFTYVNRRVRTQQQWNMSGHLFHANKLCFQCNEKLDSPDEVVRGYEGSKGAPGSTKHPGTLAFPKQAVGMGTCRPC